MYVKGGYQVQSRAEDWLRWGDRESFDSRSPNLCIRLAAGAQTEKMSFLSPRRLSSMKLEVLGGEELHSPHPGRQSAPKWDKGQAPICMHGTSTVQVDGSTNDDDPCR